MHCGIQLSCGLRTPRRSSCSPLTASAPTSRGSRLRRPLIVVRALEGSSQHRDNLNRSPPNSPETARSGSSSEAANSSTPETSTPQQAPPADTPATPPSRQSTRELDVNRAIRLLKLTSQRSSKNTYKLPAWLNRTQDPDAWDGSEQSVSSSLGVAPAGRGGHSGPGHNSSRQLGPQDAASPLDSYMALQEANSPTVDSQPSRNGSPTAAAAAAAAAGLKALNGRMFSASDPVVLSSSSSSSSSSRRQMSSPGGFSMLLEGVDDTDAAKEQERQFRRAVFSFDRWAAHRSTARYVRHFRGIFTSRTFQGLLQPMSFTTGMAVLCGLYNVYAVPKGAPLIVISSTPLDITAFAVSLLLVFRTDSSYARWEEALKTWNEVRSLSKDLARQSCYWVNEPARKAMLVRWCEAFSRALLVHCRVDGSLEHELEDVLLPHEVAAVAAVGPSGAPSFILQVLAELIEQCIVTETKEDTMFSTVRSLSDAVAVCNKLLRYPLPLAYTRHTSRFMFLWLSAMPWAMWSDMHWVCVPITAAISYLLLGIDEIGVQIEEPFGILPLEDVCVDITAEIDAMMERQDIVTDLLAAGGVDCAPRSTCGACGQPVTVAAAAAPQFAASSSGGGGGGGCNSSNSGRHGAVIVSSDQAGVFDVSGTRDHVDCATADHSSSSSSGGSSSSSINGTQAASLNGAHATARWDATIAAPTADQGSRSAALPDDSSSSSSSSVVVSSSASNGAGGITRINRSGSPQGLVARWVSSTISGSADAAPDPLSSLEDAVAPGFDLRGFVVSDLEADDQHQQQQRQQPSGGRGWSETSSLESVDVDSSSSSSSSSSSRDASRLGWYERQPAPKADHRYPD